MLLLNRSILEYFAIPHFFHAFDPISPDFFPLLLQIVSFLALQQLFYVSFIVLSLKLHQISKSVTNVMVVVN